MSVERLEPTILEQGQLLAAAIAHGSGGEINPEWVYRVEALLELTRELLLHHRSTAEARVSELFEYLRDRSEDTWVEFTQAPLLVYGTAQEEDVIGRWRAVA